MGNRDRQRKEPKKPKQPKQPKKKPSGKLLDNRAVSADIRNALTTFLTL